MKIIIIAVILLPFSVYAQQTVVQSAKVSVNPVLINKTLGDLDNLESGVVNLSIDLTALHSSIPLRKKDLMVLPRDTNANKRLFNTLTTDENKLKNSVGPSDTAAFNVAFRALTQNYRSAGWWMKQLLIDKGESIYYPQIASTKEAVNSLLLAVRNFKQEVQSLIPPVQDHSLENIIAQLKGIQKSQVIEKTTTDSLGTAINAQFLPIDGGLRKLGSMMQPDTGGKQFLIAATYQQTLFGLAYFYRLGKVQANGTMNLAGVEYIATWASPKATAPAFFVYYGLRNRVLLLQAGLGYLAGGAGSDNISWKAGIVYTPGKIGIGFSYSPLTQAGMEIAYRW